MFDFELLVPLDQAAQKLGEVEQGLLSGLSQPGKAGNWLTGGEIIQLGHTPI